MSLSEILNLIATIFAAASAVAAFITCLIQVRFSKPKIEIEIKQDPKRFFFLHFHKPNDKIVSMAYMEFSVWNTSNAGGTIARITLIYDKMRIVSENIGDDFKPNWFNMESDRQNREMFRLKTPFIIPAYNAKLGYVYFPCFPPSNESELYVTVEFEIIGKKRRTKKFINVKIANQNALGQFRYNYVGTVHDYLLSYKTEKYEIKDVESVTYSHTYTAKE